MGRLRVAYGTPRGHLANSIVNLHVYVQKMFKSCALFNNWAMSDMSEKPRKSFLVPDFKEGHLVKSQVSNEAYKYLTEQAKRKEISISEVVRQIIYEKHEKDRQSQSGH